MEDYIEKSMAIGDRRRPKLAIIREVIQNFHVIMPNANAGADRADYMADVILSRLDAHEAEIQRLRAKKTPDFSGLWGLVDELKRENAIYTGDDLQQYIGRSAAAERFEQELTKMGVRRK